MTKDELSSILEIYSGIPTRIYKDEILMETCTECGNSNWNLEVNLDKGVYNCWACPTNSGSINRLLSQFGYTNANISIDIGENGGGVADTENVKVPFPSAKNFQKAKEYLSSRGISEHDIHHYDIRFQPYEQDNEWSNKVIFPLKDIFTGEVVTYQGRSIVETAQAKYKLGRKTNRFLGYRHNTRIHVVTEGVFDAVAVHKSGYSVSMLLGLGNIKKWDAWVSQLYFENPFVVVFLDSNTEEESKLLHSKITEQLDCSVIFPPEGKDPAMLSSKEIIKQIEKVVP